MKFLQPQWQKWVAGTLLTITLACVGIWTLRAMERRPTPFDRQVTRAVVSLIQRDHLLRKRLDDEVSQRAMKRYVESLDPWKLYFMQSDVDEFMRFRNQIDDMLRNNDTRLAYDIYQRLLYRIDERVAVIDQLLETPFDFDKHEQIIRDRKLASYARTAAESRDLWRKRLKFDLLVLKSDKHNRAESLERLRRRYRSFASRMKQTSNEELLETFLTAVTMAYDPHTTYMSPSSLDNFNIIMRLNLEGIGAALQQEDGYIKVSKLIPGGAADKQGELKVEDQIVAVGEGQQGEMIDVVDMRLTDVVKHIRGKAGTTVRLSVVPADGGEAKVVHIRRSRVELKDSEARGRILNVGNNNNKNVRVGIIDLPSFYMDMEAAKRGDPNYKSSTRDVKRLINDFRQKDVEILVLDLRRNGGGSLPEAVGLSGLFIDYGSVVRVKDHDGQVKPFNDTDPEMDWRGPLVVLTSKFSASASEILAGAIKDYNRGLIIGDETTHGKGTVQSLLELGIRRIPIPNPPNLGALKLTMQQFYRPNGASTQKRGVPSDLILPSITNYMDVSEADLDYAIEFDKIAPVRRFDYGMLSPQMLGQLQARSKYRRGQNKEFVRLERQIEKYREQKRRKYISLNEKEYFALRKELSAEKAEEELLENQNESPDEIFPSSFYNDEVLAVAADYLKVLGSRKYAIIE